MRRVKHLPNRLRNHLTSAHLMAFAALFVALGGTAFAVSKVPRNSVGPAQLKRGAVKTQDISRAAVTRHKIAPRAVNNLLLAPGAVNGPKIANGSINRFKISPGAVDSSRLAPGAVGQAALAAGSVGRDALADGSVATEKLANNSVTRAKISEGSLPMLAPLRSGQTLRGMFALTANPGPGPDSVLASDAQTFEFPMVNAPDLHVIDATAGAPAPTAECPGIAGGNVQTPQAGGGKLCVYVRATTGAYESIAATAPANLSLTRLGFSLTASFGAAGGTVVGQWAATAG